MVTSGTSNDRFVRQQDLVPAERLAGLILALDRADYIALWKRLDHDPTVEEVLRNWPVRQPVLWV